LASPEPWIIFFGIISGMLYIYALIPYFKMLTLEEVSRIIPVWRFIPLFVLLFAFLFLEERFDFVDLLAFILLVAGGVLISVRKIKNSLSFSKALKYMLFSSFIYGIVFTLFKFVFQEQNFSNGFMFISFGLFLGGLSTLLLKSLRKEIVCVIKEESMRFKFVIIFNRIVYLLGVVIYNLAISLGPVSLVSAATGFQSLFVLIFATILTVKFPTILKEEITAQTFLQKTISILMLVIGAALIIIY
jgi:uncharacterized membrane protein